jgi:ATP-binding cassette subfamily B (MDR/TAP) protein 1
MDSVNESIVQEALDDVLTTFKRTTIVIAHRLSTIRNADMIVVFKEGQVVESGTHLELLGKEGSEYSKLVEAQSRPNKSVLNSSSIQTIPTAAVESGSSSNSIVEIGNIKSSQNHSHIAEIAFRNVYFSYPTRRTKMVLKGLNLVIQQGETLGLVGHSGGGKSTIIQLIERFYDVDSGSVEYRGVDVREMNLSYLRDQIGLVSQEPILFNTSIRENIRYGKPAATDQEVEEAAKKANAHDFIMSFPSRYDTDMGETGTQISGGQKQRIVIARALLKKPNILLLGMFCSSSVYGYFCESRTSK